MIPFEGELYFDDKLFVLYVAPATTQPFGQYFSTTIYHDRAPAEAEWAVVTFRNINRYPGVAVHFFDTRAEADAYRRFVEPRTPLISLGGASPSNPQSYAEWQTWKSANAMQEYDYRAVFSSGGSNQRETITTRTPPSRPKPVTTDPPRGPVP